MENQKLVSLKSLREKIFSVKDKHFSWSNYFKLKDLKQNKNLIQSDFVNDKNLDLIEKTFLQWLNIPTFLIYQDEETGVLKKYPASKRGNSVYQYYLEKSLRNDLSFTNSRGFEKFILQKKEGFRDQYKSRSIFITLTCSQKHFGNNRTRAWLGFPEYYNRFITAFKKRYGTCSIIKTVESTRAGYPHIHLIVFTQHQFNAFIGTKETKNKIKLKCLRIKEKKSISKLWKAGYIAIESPNIKEWRKKQIAQKLNKKTTDFFIEYLFKDMFKQYKLSKREDKQSRRSLSLCWLFNLKGYSISIHTKTGYSIKHSCIIQTQRDEIEHNNCNKNLIFLGVVSFVGVHPPPDSVIYPDSEFYGLIIELLKQSKFSKLNYRKCYAVTERDLFRDEYGLKISERTIQEIMQSYKYWVKWLDAVGYFDTFRRCYKIFQKGKS